MLKGLHTLKFAELPEADRFLYFEIELKKK